MTLEFCCGLDSLMGRPSYESRRSNHVRLTEREDMTSAAGIEFAKAAANSAPPDILIVIWTALPCTGGSPWQNINRRLPGCMERLRKQWQLFVKLWNRLQDFTSWLNSIRRRWRIVIEWPRNCAYWRRLAVLKFCRLWGLEDVCIDGCSLWMVRGNAWNIEI